MEDGDPSLSDQKAPPGPSLTQSPRSWWEDDVVTVRRSTTMYHVAWAIDVGTRCETNAHRNPHHHRTSTLNHQLHVVTTPWTINTTPFAISPPHKLHDSHSTIKRLFSTHSFTLTFTHRLCTKHQVSWTFLRVATRCVRRSWNTDNKLFKQKCVQVRSSR